MSSYDDVGLPLALSSALVRQLTDAMLKQGPLSQNNNQQL